MELNDVDIEILNTLGKFKCEEYINANKATTLNLPNLQEAGTILADYATTVNLPKLLQSGNIFTYNATTVNLPKLQEAININANKATTVNLPNLQQSKSIFAYNAKKIIIPSNLKRNLKSVPKDCEIIHPDLEATPKLESFKTFFYK